MSLKSRQADGNQQDGIKYRYTEWRACSPLCSGFNSDLPKCLGEMNRLSPSQQKALREHWKQELFPEQREEHQVFFGWGLDAFLNYFLLDRGNHLLIFAPIIEEAFPIGLLKHAHVHVLQTGKDRQPKMGVESIYTWIEEHPGIAEKTWVYMQESGGKTEWDAVRMQLLKELNNDTGLRFIRNETGLEKEASLLDNLPEKCLVRRDPFACTQGSSWGLCAWSVPISWLEEFWADGIEVDKGESLHSLEMASLMAYFNHREEQLALNEKWRKVSFRLHEAVEELIKATRTVIWPQTNPLFVLFDLDAYRVQFGRKEAFSNREIHQLLMREVSLELVPGVELGVPPNSLIYGMRLGNFEHPDWLEENPLEEIDESFLYKHFWDTIDGAQKMMRYLNGL